MSTLGDDAFEQMLKAKPKRRLGGGAKSSAPAPLTPPPAEESAPPAFLNPTGSLGFDEPASPWSAGAPSASGQQPAVPQSATNMTTGFASSRHIATAGLPSHQPPLPSFGDAFQDVSPSTTGPQATPSRPGVGTFGFGAGQDQAQLPLSGSVKGMAGFGLEPGPMSTQSPSAGNIAGLGAFGAFAPPSVTDERERQMQEIFALCDRGGRGGDGQISRRELISACKQHKHVADFLHLPQQFSSDDAQRKMDNFFKGSDVNGDAQLTFDEFKEGCKRLWASPQSPVRTASPKGMAAAKGAASGEMLDKLTALEAAVQQMEKKMQAQDERWQRRLQEQEMQWQQRLAAKENEWAAARKHFEKAVVEGRHLQETKLLLRQLLGSYEKEGACPLCQTLSATMEQPTEVSHNVKLQRDPHLLTPGLVSVLSELGQVELVKQMESDPKWFTTPRVQALRGAARTAAARVMVAAGIPDKEVVPLLQQEVMARTGTDASAAPVSSLHAALSESGFRM